MRLIPAFACFLLLAACAGESPQVTQAKALRKAGNTLEALTLLQSAQQQSPDDPALLTELGYSLVDSGRPKEGAAVFDRLIALRPTDAHAFNGKGLALDMTGDHQAAQAAYRQALSLAPDALNITNNLAMSYILDRNYTQAIATLAPLHEAGRDNPIIRQNLALAYALTGKKKEALALNLQDLTPEQAKDNMRFYEQYRKRVKK